MLRDGRLHLTGMALLVPLLTPLNRDAILARATHRSKREIEQLVAELQPRPDVPSGMRKLPDKRRGFGYTGVLERGAGDALECATLPGKSRDAGSLRAGEVPLASTAAVGPVPPER